MGVSKVQRDISIDALKGVLIILMVIGHSGAPSELRNVIYSFHMPAFFIISGYLVKKKYIGEVGKYIKRKLSALWWPFVLWTSIFILLHNFFYKCHILSDPYTIKEHLKYLFDGFRMVRTETLLGGFWFIRSLLFASVVSIFYLKIIDFNRIGIMCGVFVSLSFSQMFKSDLIHPINFLYLTFQNFEATAFFLAGVLFRSENLVKILDNRWVVYGSLAVCGISSVFIRGTMLDVQPISLIPYCLSSILISWGLLIAIYKLPNIKIKYYLAKMGGYTLDILIFHFLVFKLVSIIKIKYYDLDWNSLSDFPVVKENSSDLFWIVYTVVALVVCLLISLWKEYLRSMYVTLRKHTNDFKMRYLND